MRRATMIQTVATALVIAVFGLVSHAKALPYYEDSLMGYWKLDGNADDSTGNNTSGTIYGATSAEGQYGTAFRFDGNDYIDVQDSASLRPSAISIGCWIKPASLTSAAILARRLTDYIGYQVQIDATGKIGIVLGTGSGSTRGYWTAPAGSVVAGSWVYAVFTYDGAGSVQGYINGVEKDLATAVGSASGPIYYSGTQNLEIGVRNDKKMYLNGTIDDLAIWNRALDDYEIDSLFKLGVETFEAIKIANMEENLALGYTTEELNQLGGIYASMTETPVMIGDTSWRYLDILPGQDAHAIGESYTYNDKYYIKLGSGLEGTPAGQGGDVPEPTTLLLFLPFIGFGLKKIKCKM